jgi:hypothetical protein
MREAPILQSTLVRAGRWSAEVRSKRAQWALCIALSARNRYLYAGFTGSASVERYELPAMIPDLQIPLGAGNGNIGNVGGAFDLGSVESCDLAG